MVRKQRTAADSWDSERVAILEKLLEELKSLGNGDLIIVEGEKDAQSLRRIGVRSRIITKKQLKSEVISQVSEDRPNLVLLPDFDDEGRENMKAWKALWQAGAINESIWRRLKNLAKGEIKDIEGLSTLARKFGLIGGEMWLNPGEES